MRLIEFQSACDEVLTPEYCIIFSSLLPSFLVGVVGGKISISLMNSRVQVKCYMYCVGASANCLIHGKNPYGHINLYDD